ncbi:MAG: ABC-2 family transporter protein [Planctomycetes bacterium]|nr:ABC-2 family transporter protein [Planctomycetota bacterium]
MRTHWFILRTCISERLAYRGDFAFGTLVRFLPIVSSIFLWSAIYGRDDSQVINGYKLPDMIAYFLLVMVGRAFSSMPGLASGIARDVRDGTIKKYLTQPVDMLMYLFWARVAHKLVYYLVATGPFVFVFYLCRSYFAYAPDLATIGAFILSLVIAFLIGFLMESLIGLISFWFLEVSSLIFIFMMVNYFLSGHMAPLPWLMKIFGDDAASQGTARLVMMLMPFQYLAYFPAALMLGKHTGADLWQHLAVGAGWVLVLLLANRIVFARGVRRYSAFGG